MGHDGGPEGGAHGGHWKFARSTSFETFSQVVGSRPVRWVRDWTMALQPEAWSSIRACGARIEHYSLSTELELHVGPTVRGSQEGGVLVERGRGDEDRRRNESICVFVPRVN